MELFALISFGIACYLAGCSTVFIWGIKLYNKNKNKDNKVVKFPKNKEER